MTKIDRYLLFLYARVLVICFLSVAGLLVVVHVFSNMEEFLRFAEQSNASVFAVLMEYYGPFMVSIFERLSGLLALLALLFVVAWLNKTNEFTALLAAGVTKRRVVLPLLLASGVVVFGAAALREFSIPHFQDRLDRNPQDLTGDYPRSIRPTFDTRAVALLQGKHLLPTKLEIVTPILKLNGSEHAKQFGTKILSPTAYFRAANNSRPAGFLFQEVTSPERIDSIDSAYDLDGNPVLLTSKDTDWLQAGECFFVTDIEYEQLRGGSAWKQFASTTELITHLKAERVRSGNDVRVQIHQRFLRPFIDGTVLLLGIPILLTRPDRHMFWVAGACLFVVAGFSGFMFAFAALGSAGTLSPALACWMPLIAFLPFGWARTRSAMNT